MSDSPRSGKLLAWGFGLLALPVVLAFPWFLAKSWLTTPVLVVPTAPDQSVEIDGEVVCEQISPPDFCGVRLGVGQHELVLRDGTGATPHTTTLEAQAGWGQRLLWLPADPEGLCVVRDRVVFSTETQGVSGEEVAPSEPVRLRPGVHDVTGVDYVLAVPASVKQRDKSDVMRQVIEIRGDCPL